MIRYRAGTVLVIMVVLAGARSVQAQAGMPDLSQMHGRALPAGELARGTVTVRVVRETITNNLPGQDVSVTVSGVRRTALTDAEGRAEFPGLPAGSEGLAAVIVDGEELRSEPFIVPQSGGLRVILVAGLGNGAPRPEPGDSNAPVVQGSVTFGSNSRILMEFQDDTLQVFYVFEVVNTTQDRVDIGGPLVFDLPTGAAGAATLQGSAQQVSINGDRVTVTGPFAPGVTSVQLGFSLPNAGATYRYRQSFPVPLEQVTVALQRVGSASMTSTQFQSTGDVRSESGTTFILGSGPALGAGSVLAVELTGLPAHSAVPQYVAVALALAVIAWGIWLSVAGRPGEAETRRRLVARRDTLLGDLAHLEQRRRAGQASGRDASRRARIVAELEQIYGELDEAGTGPHGDGEGVAA